MMNDEDREQWVNNEQGLYNWWRRSRKGITVFVRENRKEIDRYLAAREKKFMEEKRRIDRGY
jgi:hypothetical protein